MIAEIIAVGSEMLTPHRQDTNSLFLTAGLNDLGVSVAFKTIVGDNRRHLVAAIRIAIARADIVLLSGGLGPTEDDLTRECLAQVLGVNLHRDTTILNALRARYAARKMAMPPNNARQADVLDGAHVLPNANGSAPGQYTDIVLPDASGQAFRKIIILLPGPPKELKPLFDFECRPRLSAALPAHYIARRQLRMALIPESQVDARCAPIYSQFEDVETTILAGHAEIQLHFVCSKHTLELAQQRVDTLADLIAREMGDDIFSDDGEDLEAVVLLMLGLREHTLAIAESCTGGWLGERLTSVPNSSRVFLGGAITYANALKASFTGVDPDLIAQHGAVSGPVARAMAEGIRFRTGATLGLSITGLAGPTPGTGPDADKPIGLVYIGLADGEDTQVRQLHITGDRERIRLWSTQHALELLRRSLM
ncbi:competence/damage-inducible protein A [Granulicella sp. 5B5]|uniref:competence/damage-inducible protein A n=1 Tax=Granulicella sp. 5B5 TaxID=1617967 RepID=UPI0015F55D27|nr:competence/damage-inducible protein A [Granulicella sp. 5B5]QMV18255.1 competence/damage-inducible protein A [Granulicella sp. 5B5]